jgi:glycosyltransferase involved in cell wall biosynthesis
MSPLVSVIIPCFNQARFLTDAVDCLLKQAYENWECIIVNDGSTDDTKEVAQELSEKYPRVRVINQANKGLSGARNVGLDNLKGNYVQFLDADDEIGPNKFSLQLDVLSSIDDLCLCYSDYLMGLEEDISQTPANIQRNRSISFEGNPLHDLATRWETQFSIPVHCFLFDARFFTEKNIRFDESLPNHEDWDCWMQIFSLQPVVKFLPEVLATYRVNSLGMCVNKSLMWQGFRQAILKQQRIHYHDSEMNKILKNKFYEMKLYYRPPVNKLLKPIVSWYRKNVPWPIQKFFDEVIKYL